MSDFEMDLKMALHIAITACENLNELVVRETGTHPLYPQAVSTLRTFLRAIDEIDEASAEKLDETIEFMRSRVLIDKQIRDFGRG